MHELWMRFSTWFVCIPWDKSTIVCPCTSSILALWLSPLIPKIVLDAKLPSLELMSPQELLHNILQFAIIFPLNPLSFH